MSKLKWKLGNRIYTYYLYCCRCTPFSYCRPPLPVILNSFSFHSQLSLKTTNGVKCDITTWCYVQTQMEDRQATAVLNMQTVHWKHSHLVQEAVNPPPPVEKKFLLDLHTHLSWKKEYSPISLSRSQLPPRNDSALNSLIATMLLHVG